MTTLPGGSSRILLATSRTGTMQRELNEAPPEYDFACMTAFSSTFGGREAAVILEAGSSTTDADRVRLRSR